MAKTKLQSLTALDALRQQITTTLVAGANLPGPALAQLLVQQVDEVKAEVSRGGTARNGVGVPAASLGLDNDTYTDTASGYEYTKVAGAWVFVYAKKGEPGSTPQKGTDYFDGVDGADGNRIVDKNYPPPLGRFTDGGEQQLVNYQEGDQWFHTKGLSSYDRYAYLDGQWRLVFRKAEGATPPAPSAATVTGFSPSSAAVGASVTITGTGFTGATGVLFNGVAASFQVLNATTITATVPATSASGTVAVATAAGTGYSSASFTVTVAVNQIPTASAGSDATIKLPTNSIALLGTGADADGTIAGYAWRQVTGPNTASGLPASTQNVVASGLVAGSYQFGFKATDNKGAQSSESFVLITVQAADVAPVGLIEYPIADGNYLDSAQKTQKSAAFLRSSLSRVVATTAATQIEVQAASYLAELGAYVGSFAVRVNGVEQTISITGGATAGWYAITGLSAGSKIVEILLPDLARVAVGASDVTGTGIMNLRANAAVTYESETVPTAVDLIFGTSIEGGSSANNPITQGWTSLRRKRREGAARVRVESAAGGSLYDVYGPTADRSGFLARVVSRLNGTNSNRIFIAHGVNDQGRGAATAAQFGASYAQFIDDLHAAKPGCEFFLITPFPTRNNESALADYRTQIRNLAPSRAWVTVMEGPEIVGSSLLVADGIHWNTAGHKQIEEGIWSKQNNVVYSTDNIILTASSAAITKSGPWISPPGQPNIAYVSGAAYYEFTKPAGVTGFSIYNTRQSNTPGFLISIGGEAGVEVSTLGTATDDYYRYQVYYATGLSSAAQTVRVTNSFAEGEVSIDSMNLYWIELFSVSTPLPDPTGRADSPAAIAPVGYSVAATQNFDSSTAYPANFVTDANYSVVSGEERTSGTNSLKLSAAAVETIVGPTAAITQGRFAASFKIVPGAGVAYGNCKLGAGIVDYYTISVSVIAGGGANFYLRKLNNGAVGKLFGSQITVPSLDGFIRLGISRVGSVVSGRAQRLADGKYLTSAGFTSSDPVYFASGTDEAPLPTAGTTGGVSLYFDTPSAGNAAYFDDFLLEQYT